MNIVKAMTFIDDTLTDEERNPYTAPFPNERSKAGPRRFPQLLPLEMDAPGAEISRRARDWWQNEWTGKSLVACGMHDPFLSFPVMELVASGIKNCPPVMEVPEAGHFVQEKGEVVAKRMLEILEI